VSIPASAPPTKPNPISERVVATCGAIVPSVHATTKRSATALGSGQDVRRVAAHDDHELPDGDERDECEAGAGSPRSRWIADKLQRELVTGSPARAGDAPGRPPVATENASSVAPSRWARISAAVRVTAAAFKVSGAGAGAAGPRSRRPRAGPASARGR